MQTRSPHAHGSSLAWLLGLSLAACASADRSLDPAQLATAGSTATATAGQLGGPAPQTSSPAAGSGAAPPAKAGAGGEQNSSVAGSMSAGTEGRAPSAAGHGSAAGAPQAGSTPERSPPVGGAGGASGMDGCPTRYTTATHVRLDMSWPETLANLGGQSTLHVWLKSTRSPTANGSTGEGWQCGLAIPIVTGTVLLDGLQIGSDIPTATFDLPTMPRFSERSEWKGGTLVTDSVNVVGVVLNDPDAPWPLRRTLVPFDHDADGKPGITAFLKQGDGFRLPPTDVGFTQLADQVYIASRVAVRLTATSAGCKERIEGTVEPLGFDYTVVGCHAKDRGDCNANEVNLYANNAPAMTLGTRGTWTSVPVPETATCAEIQAALPAD